VFSSDPKRRWSMSRGKSVHFAEKDGLHLPESARILVDRVIPADRDAG
jgi:hypothetical protein